MRHTSALEDYGECAASATDCSDTDDDDTDVSETSSLTNSADVLSGLTASLICSQQSGLQFSPNLVLSVSVTPC